MVSVDVDCINDGSSTTDRPRRRFQRHLGKQRRANASKSGRPFDPERRFVETFWRHQTFFVRRLLHASLSRAFRGFEVVDLSLDWIPGL